MTNQGFDSDNSGLIFGIDIGGGGDPSVCCYREGPNVQRFIEFSSDSLINTRGWIEDQIRTYRPKRCFIDNGGIGLGVVQELHQKYGGIVRGVNFGEGADDSETYANKRAEMFDRLRSFISNETISMCKSDDLILELKSMQAEPDKAKLTIVSKEKIMKAIGRSTNYLDALALTFAEEVYYSYKGSNTPSMIQMPAIEPVYMREHKRVFDEINIF